MKTDRTQQRAFVSNELPIVVFLLVVVLSTVLGLLEWYRSGSLTGKVLLHFLPLAVIIALSLVGMWLTRGSGK